MNETLHIGARVLLVDDNPAVLRLIGSLLETEGMTVVSVTSVAAARAAMVGGTEFDLVLSDISMPGESGFDLLQWIKSEGSPRRALPVLLTTAQLPEPENRVRGLAMGAVDYVERPLDPSELVLRTVNAVEHVRRLRALESSLEDAGRLASVGRLLAASNHEVKNLATLVRLAAEQTLSSSTPPASPLQATALAALDRASRLLVDVVRGVSDLVADRSPSSRPFDLVALAREVCDLMTKRVAPARLELQASQDEVWAQGQAVQIKQVLVNLLLNAAEAIDELSPAEGGSIGVSVQAAAGGKAQLQVRDNGIGLSAAGDQREFQAFATTKGMRGGSGLGLWLSSSLVQRMGGALTLSSTGPGRGATAAVELPGAARDQGPAVDLESYFVDPDTL